MHGVIYDPKQYERCERCKGEGLVLMEVSPGSVVSTLSVCA